MPKNELALANSSALVERFPVRRVFRPMPASPMVLRRFEENLALLNQKVDALATATMTALATRNAPVLANPPAPVNNYQIRPAPEQEQVTETRVNRSKLLDIFD